MVSFVLAALGIIPFFFFYLIFHFFCKKFLRNYVYIYKVKMKCNKTVEKFKKINNNNNNHNKPDKTLTQCMDYPHGLHCRSIVIRVRKLSDESGYRVIILGKLT